MPNTSPFELRTLPGLWRWYDDTARRYAFHAQSPDEAIRWQADLRETLTRVLGGFPTDRCALDAHTIEVVEEATFTRELIVFQSNPGEYVPCYVLTPRHAEPPYQPVIALHGHSSSPHQLIGLARDEREREQIRTQNLTYARALVERGFLVFVPGQRGIADRMEDPPYRDPANIEWMNTCQMAGLNALLCGKTLLGLRVWDVMRLIDLISARPEPTRGAPGCIGLSGGGTTTLFTAALDPRIACAVVSGYFNTFRDSLMAIMHCSCNFVPGLLQYAEMSDIAGLIAPRPVLIESGTRDEIFPIEATRRAMAALRDIYAVFEADDHVAADFFDGDHQWHGTLAYPWLERWLLAS